MAEKKIKAIFLIEPTLKQRAEKRAKEQGLTFSAVLRKLLLDYVGGDLTTEDEIMEIKEELTSLKERIGKIEIVSTRMASLDELEKCFASINFEDFKKYLPELNRSMEFIASCREHRCDDKEEEQQ